MSDARDLGRMLGEGLAAIVAKIPGAGDALREAFAAKYGRCIDCDAPLGGPSPSKICADCHAARVLAQGLGGAPSGDA